MNPLSGREFKETADQFNFNGDYYVAPLDFVPSAMIFYDKQMIDGENLEDRILFIQTVNGHGILSGSL